MASSLVEFPFTYSAFLRFLENHSAPPDVTGYTNTTTDGIQVERSPLSVTSAQRQIPKYGNAELMDTGDGESWWKFKCEITF